MGIVNRRNAVLGWGVWKVGKRFAKRKARGAVPSTGGGRPKKKIFAVSVAGIVGALTFWRKRRSSDND